MSSFVQPVFEAVLRGRQSVKNYDPSFQLQEEEILELLELANRAPSAWNLQHWKFMIFTDPMARKKLLPIANGQRQIVDASVIIAILGDLQAQLHAEEVYEPLVQSGVLSKENKRNIMNQIEQSYANAQTAREEAIRNASLAAMQLMTAAKAKGFDSGPMGGYDARGFMEAFQIPPRYIPVLLVAIGKAASPAPYTDRFPIERKIIRNHYQTPGGTDS